MRAWAEEHGRRARGWWSESEARRHSSGRPASPCEVWKDHETGETFRALGIENFLEGDFLGWYTDEWSDQLRAAVRRLVRELGDYEPGTSSLRPELTQDLLKELYHGLLPRDLRHALGEYYTPDWLAEYTLDRAEYIGRPGVRMLDPACGSGTFLVIAIRRLKEAARALGQSSAEIATAITSGIHGFDLNPLAVIAARTNYLLAAGDLVGAITPFRIPVFICDSITGVHVEDDSAPMKRPVGNNGTKSAAKASRLFKSSKSSAQSPMNPRVGLGHLPTDRPLDVRLHARTPQRPHPRRPTPPHSPERD